MSKQENIGRAKLLLELQPVGVFTPKDLFPWVVQVLCFLLQRYIKGD